MRLVVGVSRRIAAMVALSVSLVVLTSEVPAARSQAAQIDTIAPASGRAGDRITIMGRGFGALKVSVTVGGIPAEILSASGYQVTFVAPRGLAGGPTTLLSRRTREAGSDASGSQIAGGVLLPGGPEFAGKRRDLRSAARRCAAGRHRSGDHHDAARCPSRSRRDRRRSQRGVDTGQWRDQFHGPVDSWR